ncbi:unnamed protein product [Heterobilharzia americana]|nr:unnamed protein product [Heterobilharzia americana]
MGAIHSLIDAPGGYSVLQKNSETRHCRFCGSAYNDVCTKDVIHTSGLENHHPAELCGIWLGKLYLNQMRNLRLHGDFRTSSTLPSHCAETEGDFESFGSPLITLPKRSCPSTKSHVATLLRHSDASKIQSTLREDFFSTMDVHNLSAAQYAELEGCRISGCLFVEHGNLVFQAVNKRSRIPFLLIDQQVLGSTADCVPSAVHSTYKAGFSDSLKICSQDQNSLPPFSSFENSSHLMNSEKMGQKCSVSQMDSPYEITKRCPENTKPRLPPPPLRLSWPLVTLRRFGFYGNSLFKVETGRRAPRGEGLYLFRIKHLREFKRSFEMCVHHRRDSLSVHHSSLSSAATALGNRSLLRTSIGNNNSNNNNSGKMSLIMPLNKFFHKQSQSSSTLTSTVVLQNSVNDQCENLTKTDSIDNSRKNTLLHHRSQQIPSIFSERNNLAFSFDDIEFDFLQEQTIKSTYNNKNNKIQQRQARHDRVSSNCLHWLQLQNTPFSNNENNNSNNNNRLTNINNQQNHDNQLGYNFKYSCPQLSDISLMNPTSWNDDPTSNGVDICGCQCAHHHHHHPGVGDCCQHRQPINHDHDSHITNHFRVHRSNHHRQHCHNEDIDDDKIVDITEKFSTSTVVDDDEDDDDISNLPEAPLPPVYNNSSYCDIIQEQNVYHQKIYDNIIVINNSNNDESIIDTLDDSNRHTLLKRPPPTPTVTSSTISSLCLTHQRLNSLKLSEENELEKGEHKLTYKNSGQENVDIAKIDKDNKEDGKNFQETQTLDENSENL